MMGPEYFTVAAYLEDCTILCRDCGEKQALPASKQLTVAQVEAEYQDTGLYCDACSAEIAWKSQSTEKGSRLSTGTKVL